MVYSTMYLDSYAGMIFCGSNYIVMHFIGKEYDVAPYNEAYETIKAVKIVQASIAYGNPETGYTAILILNEAIWMGETIDHALVHPNQLRTYGMIFQDNPFSEALIFTTKKYHDFMLPLSSKGTIIGVTTRNLT